MIFHGADGFIPSQLLSIQPAPWKTLENVTDIGKQVDWENKWQMSNVSPLFLSVLVFVCFLSKHYEANKHVETDKYENKSDWRTLNLRHLSRL